MVSYSKSPQQASGFGWGRGRTVGYTLNNVRQTTIGYDAATGRIVTMQTGRTGILPVQEEGTFTWSYLPGSDLKSSLAYPNGLTASWTYDANGQLLLVRNATPTDVISQYDYTYDAAGRRINVSKAGTAFDQVDTVAYCYNSRSELTNAVAAVDSAYRYAYDFDEIGNRETSIERGTNAVYTANNLDQYTAVDDFTPQFDDDGNQTLVKTATGIWSVTYNGENRPIYWKNGDTDITMSYDRMGRRNTKNGLCFVYKGYLQIANFGHSASNVEPQVFVWDPMEPVATRPLTWSISTTQLVNSSTFYYVYDGNKNVSEAIKIDGDIAAHYEYAPFGSVVAQCGVSAPLNPWRFSCEYADDEAAMVEATGSPDDPSMKPSSYAGPLGDSEHGPIYGREPGNRAPDGTGWKLPFFWDYSTGRLGKAVDYTKQDLRKYLGTWCEKCCRYLEAQPAPYYGPRPTMGEFFSAIDY